MNIGKINHLVFIVLSLGQYLGIKFEFFEYFFPINVSLYLKVKIAVGKR